MIERLLTMHEALDLIPRTAPVPAEKEKLNAINNIHSQKAVIAPKRLLSGCYQT